MTAFTYRAGGLLEGQVAFRSEVDALFQILSVSDPPDDNDLKLIQQLQEELWKMPQADGAGIAISPFGRLKGEWVRSKLKAHIDRKANARGHSIVLQLKFGTHTHIPLSALAFAWLKRRIDRRMSDACFPIEYLQTAEDALVRAASESQYSLEPSELELVITRPSGEQSPAISMKRVDGRVIIDGI